MDGASRAGGRVYLEFAQDEHVRRRRTSAPRACGGDLDTLSYEGRTGVTGVIEEDRGDRLGAMAGI